MKDVEINEFLPVTRKSKNFNDGRNIIIVPKREDGDCREDIKKAYGGHLHKKYIAIRDGKDVLHRERTIKDSRLFKDLFKSAKKKEYHYSTYLDDVLRPTNGEKIYIPHTVQGVFKDLPCNATTWTAFCEVVGSRLANAMGVKTVFNIPMEVDTDDEYGVIDYPEYYGVFSVDYVPPTYKSIALDEIDDEVDIEGTAENSLAQFEKVVRLFASNHYVADLENTIERLKKEFMKLWFFRNIICEDCDLAGRNISLLVGKNGELKLAPCHDMEMFFFTQSDRVFNVEMKDAVMFFSKNMPEVLEELLSRYGQLVESGEFEEIFTQTVKVAPYLYQDKLEKMIERYQQIIDFRNEQLMDK